MWLQWIGMRIITAWITPRSGTSLWGYRTPLNNGLVFLQLLIQELKKTLSEQGASDPSSEIWGSIKGPLPNSAGSKSRFSSAFSSIPSRMYRAPGRALAQDLDGSNDVWRCAKAWITGSESIQLQPKRWQVWLDAIRSSWICRYVFWMIIKYNPWEVNTQVWWCLEQLDIVEKQNRKAILYSINEVNQLTLSLHGETGQDWWPVTQTPPIGTRTRPWPLPATLKEVTPFGAENMFQREIS